MILVVVPVQIVAAVVEHVIASLVVDVRSDFVVLYFPGVFLVHLFDGGDFLH